MHTHAEIIPRNTTKHKSHGTSETFVVGKIVCVCFVFTWLVFGLCENRFVMWAPTIKSPGA